MGARLLKPAVYLLAFASVFLLLLSAVDITPDIIDGVSTPPSPTASVVRHIGLMVMIPVYFLLLALPVIQYLVLTGFCTFRYQDTFRFLHFIT
jgi:hypothetical protein